MTQKSATLILDGENLDLPVRSGTLGPEVIEILPLTQKEHFTFDPGFYATASCESKITYIDGDQGILLHRGYPIDQLAFQCDYMDVCYLLMHGELPNPKEKNTFVEKIKKHSSVDVSFSKFFSGFHADAHPMSMLVSVAGALSAFYPEASHVSDENIRELSSIQLIAKIPTIAAMCYKHSKKEAFLHPESHMSYAENFLHMMFGQSEKDKAINPILAKAMDRIFILHADHEQNASTSTVRMAGSTGTNPFAAISAGISALWGPAHGGANEACLNMLKEIGDIAHINKYIEKAKDKNDPFRLMGFGHRVYKNYDPRAKVMKETCHEVLDTVGLHDDPLFKLALKLEKIALEDPYFIEKKLYPNVDFYSGLTLNALGIPSNMFTVIFALARTVGWVSQWMEMMSDPHQKLARPRQLYTGEKMRDVGK